MNVIRTHIVFKVFSILLIASLLTPSIVKLAHIFEHHEHIVCTGEDATHIHQVDLDCDFQDFQLNNNLIPPKTYSNIIFPLQKDEITPLTYKFHYKHRHLSFSLRGPPILV